MTHLNRSSSLFKVEPGEPARFLDGREALTTGQARLLADLLSAAAMHANDRGAATDLRIAAGAAFDAWSKLERLQRCGAAS